jgi:hypothetical protein
VLEALDAPGDRDPDTAEDEDVQADYRGHADPFVEDARLDQGDLEPADGGQDQHDGRHQAAGELARETGIAEQSHETVRRIGGGETAARMPKPRAAGKATCVTEPIEVSSLASYR